MSRIPLRSARRRLLVHWCAGTLFATLTLFAQTLGGRHGDGVDRVWSWLATAVVPTLSLVTAVVGADARGPRRRDSSVDRFFYRLTVLLTWVYLGALCLILWLPWQSASFLQRAGLFTAIFQGVVAASFGIFFTQTTSDPKPEPAS